MAHTLWTAVDDHYAEALIGDDAVLTRTLAANRAAGLPPIDVSPLQGKWLHLLTRAIGAKRVLEIGTLGGYSAIWIARALPPDGRLITLELDATHARVARANLADAGVGDRAEVREGRAIDTLDALARDHVSAFDLVFIDADKASNADYFAWSVDHVRPGGVIVVDNVVRKGAVVDPAAHDDNVLGVRRLREAVAHEPRVSATVLQTVGHKGYDGFLMAVVGA